MPGVAVSTQTRTGPASPLRAPSGQVFMAGLSERGSTTAPMLLRSFSDVTNILGARVSYGSLYDQLKTFFDEGGQQAYVVRVVGPAASVGTLTLQDRHSTTPANTVRIDAANQGSWSTQLKVTVLDGSLANTYRIVITLNDVVVEDKTNLATPADAVTAFQESNYVRATNLGSATVAPDNIPDTIPATALSAGADDRASITSTHYVTSLTRFSPDLGDGSVCIPGQTVNAIWIGLRDHAIANNRIALLAAAISESKANLLTRAAEIDSEYCGLFTPWIRVSDGSNGYRTISPEGYVAACRARAHDQVGPWRAAAGSIAKANTVLGLDITYTKADSEDLNNGRVNVTRFIANTVRLYGWRSMSSNIADYELLKDRDLLNYLEVQSEKRLEDYVFAPIDSRKQLQSAINAALVGLVDPIARQGGLFPLIGADNFTVVDPGYKVETGSEVNSTTNLAQNTINARLLVRIAPAGQLIALTIVKVGLLSGM